MFLLVPIVGVLADHFVADWRHAVSLDLRHQRQGLTTSRRSSQSLVRLLRRHIMAYIRSNGKCSRSVMASACDRMVAFAFAALAHRLFGSFFGAPRDSRLGYLIRLTAPKRLRTTAEANSAESVT